MSTSDPSLGLAEELAALRGPLTGFCYRMLGAAGETEDAVQETLLRAHQHLHSFDPARARLTTWVHRIAHNVCVDLLRASRRRALAVDLGPEAVPGTPLPAPLSSDHFIEPMPGSRVLHALDPAERAVERESVRLAFVAALQHLTPQQRSAVVLRDVLRFSAAETGEVLGCSTASANSALQRGRAKLAELDLSRDMVRMPDPREEHELLRRYVEAFESHDVDRLLGVLREDAVTSMPPFAWWVRGAANIARLTAGSEHCRLDRLVPTDVNGSPGLGQYHPDADGTLRPFALLQVGIRDGRVSELVTFLEAAHRFEEFGLPTDLGPATDEFEGAVSYKG